VLAPASTTRTAADLTALAERLTGKRLASDAVALDALVTVLEQNNEDDPYRAALALFRALKTLAESHTTKLSCLGARGEFLANTLVNWRNELAHKDLSLAGDLFWEATPSPTPVTVFGYDTLSRTEARFLSRLCADGSTVVIPEGVRMRHAAELLASFGEWTAIPLQKRAVPSPPVERFLFRHEGDEIEWALARAKHAVVNEGLDANEIGVVLATPENYLARFVMAADRAGLPVASSLTVPLSSSEIGHIIAGLLARGQGPQDSLTTEIEHRLTQRARSAPRGTVSWGEFVIWLIGELRDELDNRTAAIRSSLVERRLVDVYLRALNALDPSGNRLTRAQDFFRRASLVASQIRTPLVEGTDGITLLSPHAFTESTFDLLMVLGAQANSLPPPLASDPYLSFAHYQAIPTLTPPLTLAAIQAERTESLLLSSSQLIMCAPAELNGVTADPSTWPLLPSAWKEAPAYRPMSVHGIEDYPNHLAKRNPRVQCGVAIERKRLSPEPFGPYDGVVGENLASGPLSVSEIIEIGRCGFKWFMAHRLKTARQKLRSLEPDLSLVGIAIHSVLERIVTEQLPLPVDIDHTEALLADVTSSLSPTPAWKLRRRDYARSISETTALAEFDYSHHQEVRTEYAVTARWHELTLKGRLDRLDRTTDDTWTILDYKSRSTVPKGVVNHAGTLDLDPQLAIYSELLSLGEQMTVGGAYYVLVHSPKAQASSSKIEGEYLRQLAARVRTAVTSGSLPPMPDVNREVCRGCDFARVCRVGPRIELRRKAKDVADP